QIIRDIDVKSYNAKLPGGTFTLQEDRWQELEAWRFKPETIEKSRQAGSLIHNGICVISVSNFPGVIDWWGMSRD
ncbi:hypothetical protein, partial [Undibacterium sp. RuRC25W]|uniref:hypothetical protein n=1 Tax=Undibacterium sp. RuRC25W TaxID=3413047 RepID=UPI003BF025EE